MFKQTIIAAAILTGSLSTPSLAQAQDASETQTLSPAEQEMQRRLEALSAEDGRIKLKGAPVTLNVPQAYGFYDKTEARFLLEDVWGNPPDDTILGMVFPMSEDQSWVAVYTYEKTGYVSDEDAATTDFDKVLRDLKTQTREANRYRKREGYQTIELVGWAVEPKYDAAINGIFWAKDLIFEGDTEHTLNYDMRMLGRRGVLAIGFIATLDDIQAIEAAGPEMMQMVTFDEGYAYADYQPGDKTAGYGVAALVAGGTGAAIAKKAGLFGVIAVLLKKFWFVGIAAVMALIGGLRRLFGGNG